MRAFRCLFRAIPFLLALAASTMMVAAQEAVRPDSAAVDTLGAMPPVDSMAAAALPAPAPLGPADPAELEAFMDGLLEGMLEAHHIAGATVAVVRGDSLLLARGYGYADLEARTPVDADATLFRIGSISKLFVWTAVMQLAAQEQLDLDADVNAYLADFEIPPTFPEPITLKHLMTHTPGFEDQVIGLFARDASRVRPLGEILREELPARVRPPGQLASYSNHGTGIAAYIVEQVSGLSFDDYVEKHILEPLGMTHTTFRQPVPATLASGLSKGYSYGGGAFHEEDFEYVPLAPVGAASTTATDMARFMMAHLHGGRLGEAVILDSTTARRMKTPLFDPAPGVNPMAYGFIGEGQNGHRAVGHGGDTFWFHAQLALLPDDDVGLFVAFNSANGGQATGEVYEAFMDRYFPAGDVPAVSPSGEARDALRRFAGSYRGVRYSHTTLAKLAAAFFTVKVDVTDEGLLKTDVPEVIRWVETAPLLFREEHGLRTLAFREDDDGEVSHLYFGLLPIIAFEKISPLEAPPVQLGLLAVALLLFLGVVVMMPVAALWRRKHGVKPERKTRIPIAARGMAWLACLGFLIFAVGLGLILTDPNQIAYAVPQSLQILLWFPLVAAVLTGGLLIYAVLVWIFGWGRASNRLGLTLLALVCLAFVGQLYYWNLLGFHY